MGGVDELSAARNQRVPDREVAREADTDRLVRRLVAAVYWAKMTMFCASTT